jgi:hypothetical protein
MKGLNTEAIDSPDFDRQIKNITRMNPAGSASEKMILNRFLATPMVQDFNLKGREWIDQAHEWLQTVKSDLQKKYPEADLSDLEELAHKMYEDYLARIGELEEGYSAGAAGGAGLGEEVDEGQIYSTGGGAGQSYRKFKPKSGGIAESLLEYKLPYKMGKQDSDMQQIDNMIAQLPDGLDVSRVWYFTKEAFKRLNPKMNYQQQKEEFDKLKYGFYDVYKKTHKEKSLLDKAKDMVGLDEGGYGYELNELKCWPGYTRVRGVPAGAPGSCKKKTKESSIMKGLQAEDLNEYDIDSQRKIEFSKENPPDLYYLYQQFIQRMLNPDNTIDPNEWIDKVNKHYGLNYTWKDYQKRGHNDHTNNWQKIVDKYILKK